MNPAVRYAVAFLASLWIALSAALAFDAAVVGQAERAAQTFRSDLDRINQELRNPALTDQQLSERRIALEGIRVGALESSASLTGPIGEVNQQLASLGPAPAEGATEAEAVARTRADLRASLDRLQSVKSQLDVIAVEAEQATGRVGSLQREQFFQRVFDRNRSILNPQLWYDSWVGLSVLSSRLTILMRNWWSEVSRTANPLGLLLIPLFVALFAAGYTMLSRWVSRWTARHTLAERTPGDLERLWRIVRGQITTVAAITILVLPIELALLSSGYSTPRINMVWSALTASIFGTLIYYMLARRIAAPGMSQWRVVDLDDTAASRFTLLAGLAAFVAVLNTQLTNVAEGLYLGVNYAVGQSALAALAMLVLLSLILLELRRQRGLEFERGRKLYFGWAKSLVPLLWLLIILGFGALLFGYLSLANYIAQKVFRTGLLLVVLFLLHHLSDAAVAASLDPQTGIGRVVRRVTGLGERAIERAGLIFRTLIDILLVLAGLPLLFALWTVTWVDFASLLNTASLGFTIGEITLSPGTVAVVLSVLIAGVVLTKLFNRWLDKRILAETRISPGVQASIRTGTSYVGYFIAAALAFSAAGLNFSNIAIIAGALGVGIGLGLQSIVNNFVSGLILLAERPIRVGDWVVLPVGEGLVKRINVRSTVIETFDSCDIIVPNSDLITEPVRNWTHGDNMGQFLVSVTVDYHVDAEQVQKLLLETARAHPKVLTSPEPGVVLARFGPSGLDFELRGFVGDVFARNQVASDIRFSLLGLFREKGITIPVPVPVMQVPQR